MMDGCNQEERCSEDSILPDITVEPFTSIRFKAPRPPDHSTFRTANRLAKVDVLEIFKGHVVIQVTDHFSLLPDEWLTYLKNNFWFYIGSKYN